jgi:hypothetical protein
VLDAVATKLVAVALVTVNSEVDEFVITIFVTLVFVPTKLLTVISVAPKVDTINVLALIFVANILADEIKLVTSKLEVVIPPTSRDPVLAAVATKLTAVALLAKSSPALILLEKIFAAEINPVANRFEAVKPETLRVPILDVVATKLTVVALEAKSSPALTLVENRLAADIKYVTNNEEVVIPPTSKAGAEIKLAFKLPPIYRSLPIPTPPAIVNAPPAVALSALVLLERLAIPFTLISPVINALPVVDAFIVKVPTVSRVATKL